MKQFHLAVAALLLVASGGAFSAQAASAAAAEPPAATASAANAKAFNIRPVDDAWRAALPRQAEAATKAYMERLPVEAVARSNAYFEGGTWLHLWEFLLGLVISVLMLGRQRAARVRDWAQRIGRKAFLRDAVVGAVFAVASAVLFFPLTVYQEFVREHAYGMATQGFGAWLGEALLSLGVSTVITALAVAGLYAIIRRTGERWWLWGTAGAMALMTVALVVAPVWIAPLFNTYKPLEEGPTRQAVVQLAQSNGVPTHSIFEVDASRQTTRVSANVTGLFGSAAIRLNDNLLRRTSLPEIRTVMAHEMGHYVMNHPYKMLVQFALLLLAGFLFAKWALEKLLAQRGAHWGLKGVADVAGLPLFMAVFSSFMFLATPVVNTIVRTQEVEADRFALNLAREPHAHAEVLLKLTEYRKPHPGPIEEALFFTHPSTYHRVLDAMRWREAMGTP